MAVPASLWTAKMQWRQPFELRNTWIRGSVADRLSFTSLPSACLKNTFSFTPKLPMRNLHRAASSMYSRCFRDLALPSSNRGDYRPGDFEAPGAGVERFVGALRFRHAIPASGVAHFVDGNFPPRRIVDSSSARGRPISWNGSSLHSAE